MIKQWSKLFFGLSLVILIFLAGYLRFTHLATLPFDLDGDFASCGLEAGKFLNREYKSLTDFGWAGIPIIGYASVALGLFIFGQNLIGLSALSAVMGVVSIALIYHVASLFFNRRIGLIAAALLTISYAHIQLSRTPTYHDPVFWLLISLELAAIAQVKNKIWAWILSGAAAALAFLMYFSGRIGLIIFGLTFVCQILISLFNRDKKRSFIWVKHMMWWTLGFCLLIIPFLPHIVGDFGSFMVRSREVFLFNPEVMTHMRGIYSVESTTDLLINQTSTSLMMYYRLPDRSTQFGFRVPLVELLTFSLFCIGLGTALRYVKQFRFQLLFFQIVLITIMGGILTSNAPFWPRIIGLIIPVSILAGVGGDQLLQRLVSWKKHSTFRQYGRIILYFGCVLIFVSLAKKNWQTYLTAKAVDGTERTHIARYIATASAQLNFSLVSENFHPKDREFLFLIPNRISQRMSPQQFLDSVIKTPPEINQRFIIPLGAAEILSQLNKKPYKANVKAHIGQTAKAPVFYEVYFE